MLCIQRWYFTCHGFNKCLVQPLFPFCYLLWFLTSPRHFHSHNCSSQLQIFPLFLGQSLNTQERVMKENPIRSDVHDSVGCDFSCRCSDSCDFLRKWTILVSNTPYLSFCYIEQACLSHRKEGLIPPVVLRGVPVDPTWTLTCVRLRQSCTDPTWDCFTCLFFRGFGNWLDKR